MVDPDFKHECLIPHPMQYYVVENKHSGMWFICVTLPFPPLSEDPTRGDCRFYKCAGREMPDGSTIGPASNAVAHHGKTGSEGRVLVRFTYSKPPYLLWTRRLLMELPGLGRDRCQLGLPLRTTAAASLA